MLVFPYAFAQEKEYLKEYYDSGVLEHEGWRRGGERQDYWIFYRKDGSILRKGEYRNNQMHGYWYFYSEENTLLKEGHFIFGLAEKWWILYEGNMVKKVRFEAGRKTGFALCYQDEKLKMVEKYIADEKTGEWTSLYAFKKDNPEVKF